MKKIAVIVVFAGLGSLLFSCFNTVQPSPVQMTLEQYSKYANELENDVDTLLIMVQNGTPLQLRKQFNKARKTYKKIEWLVEYYQPYTAKHINGPALQEVEADEKDIIIEPVGFQVIEELLFPELININRELLFEQVKMLQSVLKRVHLLSGTITPTDAQIFDALRLQIIRMISLGLSGFDSPVANNSIDEAGISLKSIEENILFYSNRIARNDEKLVIRLQKLFSNAQQFLTTGGNFNSFDRASFISTYLNPISDVILECQSRLEIALINEKRVLKPGAKHLFSDNAFDADFYTSGTESFTSPEKIALGKKLFSDGILSLNGKRSCATCHKPSSGFADALVKSLAIDEKTTIKRNTPTLINAALQPALFYDTRVQFLEDQATEVIQNKDEMHGSFDVALKKLRDNPDYSSLFAKTFKGVQINDWHIRNALAAYIRSLVGLNTRFDRYMRGDQAAISVEEKEGFNLFMGKAKCGTCHFAPLFNGANPPMFEKIDAEVLGVPATNDTTHPVLDPDGGKYSLYGIELHKHAFKTPSVRNIALTAPYMHNGVFSNLEEVVEFYNRGGGKGMGMNLENQTLPDERLHLSTNEKKAIIAFMKSLTDTSFRH